MPEFDVTAFGESMLRLSTPAGRPIELAGRLDLGVAGAETNVLAALAQLGLRCAWYSALPDNALGRLAANQLRMRGIDLSGLIWTKTGRMGVYFVEIGAAPRPTRVIYDRAGSSVSMLEPAKIDWHRLLDTRMLHLTGITPALSPECLQICRQAARSARDRGIALSFDINYREKLWPHTDRAAEIFLELAEGVDLLFCPQADAVRVFGYSGQPQDVARRFAAETGARNIVISMADEGLIAWDGQRILHQPALETTLIDPIGAGDALAAGVIYGWLSGSLQAGLKTGAVLAALTLSQHGDMLLLSRDDLKHILDNGGDDVLR